MSDLHLRRATPDDAPALAANSLRCYPTPGATLAKRLEAYLSTGPYPLDTVTLVERDGVLVGQARTIDYRAWFGGVEVGVGGLAGVAVAPEARRGGVAAALVRNHVAECRDRGAAWSLLYPFSPRFYAAHGWAAASRRLRWRIAPSALPIARDRAPVRRVAWETPGDLAALQACYARHCVATNGSLSRSDRVLSVGLGRTPDSQHAVGVGGAELGGYLIYTIAAPTAQPQTMVVHELVALDAAAERALLGFIAAQSDQVNAVLIDTPVEHPLAAMLDNGIPEREDGTMPTEHHPLATLYSGYMARIIDLRAALERRGYRGRSGRVAIELTDDPLVSANRRTVTLTVADGVPSVAEGAAPGATRVAGGVGPLSALLCGGVRLAAAARAGLVAVTGDVTGVDKLLALPVPYPLVYF